MSWRNYWKVQNFFLSSRNFSIEKETGKFDKDDNEDIKTISFKIKFIDSARFMASSLLNLVDNLEEGIHKIKCKDLNFVFLNTKVPLRI